jgi:hypothetical protein
VCVCVHIGPYQIYIILFSASYFVQTSTSSIPSLTAVNAHQQQKGKGKAVPLHALEALGGRGGIAPTHS